MSLSLNDLHAELRAATLRQDALAARIMPHVRAGAVWPRISSSDTVLTQFDEACQEYDRLRAELDAAELEEVVN